MSIELNGLRVFPPLAADHPAVGIPCSECGLKILAGQRTVLVPKIGTQKGWRCEGGLAHANCALAGLKTPIGKITVFVDTPGNQTPILLEDGRLVSLAECGLE